MVSVGRHRNVTFYGITFHSHRAGVLPNVLFQIRRESTYHILLDRANFRRGTVKL